MDSFKERTKKKSLGKFDYKIIDILVMPTCSLVHDDDKRSKESKGVIEEVGVENVPDIGITPEDA